MKKLSLTTFVDFVLKTGTPKITVVRTFKKQDKYSPQTDFYKTIRDAIVDLHKENKDKKALDQVLQNLTHEAKQGAYPELIGGYKKFLGKKAFTWFSPPSTDWKSGDLVVNVNPELGLVENNSRFVIKLYFKSEKLSKTRSAVVTHLMNAALSSKTKKDTQFGVLDVRESKLYLPGVPVADLDALLAGEAAAFATIYKNL